MAGPGLEPGHPDFQSGALPPELSSLRLVMVLPDIRYLGSAPHRKVPRYRETLRATVQEAGDQGQGPDDFERVLVSKYHPHALERSHEPGRQEEGKGRQAAEAPLLTIQE